MTEPVLTTIFLSWNRPTLLRQAIDSYQASTTVPREVFLVDNASSTPTRDVIRGAQRSGDLDRVLLLRRNRGGVAFNRMLPRVRGKFVHFSENDLEYSPGWDEVVVRKFDAFPRLGQLSLFSPWPIADDGDVAGPPNAIERVESQGEVVYSTPSVTSSCIVRRELIEAGLRWTNIVSGRFRFPNDIQLSRDVRNLGYDVAWNDDYLAKNWGHNIAEMSRDVEYYLENYANKNWVGVTGLSDRLAELGYQLRNDNGTWTIDRPQDSGGAAIGARYAPKHVRLHRLVNGTSARLKRFLKS